MCISGNNLLCSMIFYPSLIIQHTTGTDRFFKTQKCISVFVFSTVRMFLGPCIVWARINARYVSLSALSANFLPSVWCLMSRSQPVPVSSLSQYIHSMLLRHNSDLFMTNITYKLCSIKVAWKYFSMLSESKLILKGGGYIQNINSFHSKDL